MPERVRDVVWLDAEVTANRPVCGRYRTVDLAAPEVATRTRPGQFVMLRPFKGFDPLLPRPMAVYKTSPAGFSVLYMVAGRGTSMLSEAQPGSRCAVLGPLGVPWTPVAGAARHIAIGGGTGIAALRIFARSLPPQDVLFLMGARGADGLVPEAELELPGVRVRTATDNGETGFHGTVIALLESLLAAEPAGLRCAIYAAGPTRMMAAAARLAAARGIPCRVSLEAFMACGLGVCRACVVTGCKPHPRTGLKRRAVCMDGPVMDAEEIDWASMK